VINAALFPVAGTSENAPAQPGIGCTPKTVCPQGIPRSGAVLSSIPLGIFFVLNIFLNLHMLEPIRKMN
jgi:hypothetical protein